MFFNVLYILFSFFVQKQIYAGSHFTGGDKRIGKFIAIIGILNLLIALAFLLYMAIKISLLHSIILFVASSLFTYIANRVLTKIAMKQALKSCDIQDTFLFSIYNYKCDILTTITAEIGIIVNILIIIVYIVNSIIGY